MDKKNKVGKKTNFLDFNNPVRVYSRSDLQQVFIDIRDSYFLDAQESFLKALEKPDADKKGRSPEEIRDEKIASLSSDLDKIADVVLKESGSHLLKFRNAEFNKSNGDENNETSVLRLTPLGKNVQYKFYPSMNAAKSKLAKVIFRPIEIEGHTRIASLVEHIVAPDSLSDEIQAAFGEIFGEDMLASIKANLRLGNTHTTGLPFSDFPIVFAPGTDGDVQISPIHPAEAYPTMQGQRNELFELKSENDTKIEKSDKEKRKNKRDESIILKDEEVSQMRDFSRRIWSGYSRQFLSSQTQNISPAFGGSRVRFHANFPRVMNDYSAQIYRFSLGGRQPEIQDADIAERISTYVEFSRTWKAHHSPKIEAAMDRIARGIIFLAKEYADEFEARAREINPDFNGRVNIPNLCFSAFKMTNKAARAETDEARHLLGAKHFTKLMETLA